MTISNYPNGFANGVNIRGVPILNTYGGEVFWVDSARGSDSHKGTFDRPFATLDYAIGRCTANNGDVILIKANHAETITGAGGIAADVAGVTIIGLGTYNQRPRFLMDGGTTVTVTVSAADVTFQNLVFAAGHADIVTCFNITAVGCTLQDLEFVDNTADENFVTEIKGTSTTDNNADGLKVLGCRAYTPDASGAEFIELAADVNGLVAQNNFVSKDAGTSAGFIVCATGKDLTNCLITHNYLVSGATSGALFINSDTSANSGIVAYNTIGHHDSDAAVPIDVTGARLVENYAIGVDDASGLLLPAVDDNS